MPKVQQQICVELTLGCTGRAPAGPITRVFLLYLQIRLKVSALIVCTSFAPSYLCGHARLRSACTLVPVQLRPSVQLPPDRLS